VKEKLEERVGVERGRLEEGPLGTIHPLNLPANPPLSSLFHRAWSLFMFSCMDYPPPLPHDASKKIVKIGVPDP
jgi:hypothetical protein